jgi:ribosomal protein L11 methyltransferase
LLFSKQEQIFDCQLNYYNMQNSVLVKIASENTDIRAVLAAELNELGYEGFEEEDAALLAYCPENGFDEPALDELLAPRGLTYTKTIIPAQNWNAVWESNFSPVVVDGFVGVRAEFHAPLAGVQHEIVITPKMSFGTGHHATTRMMMQQMEKLNLGGRRVFDFGTGTGILAILAEKLGAATVVAVDYDEWCITNAAENIERNNCRHITLSQAGAPPAGEHVFDIILANINKHIILQFLPLLKALLVKDGCLLLSGLLAEDEQDILQACGNLQLGHACTVCLDKWICMLFMPNN